MNNLTEKYRRGALPSMDASHNWLSYYIKHENGLIHSDSYCLGMWGSADSASTKEILASVPHL